MKIYASELQIFKSVRYVTEHRVPRSRKETGRLLGT